jgi:hypothetical protein
MQRRRDPRKDPIICRFLQEMEERVAPDHLALCNHPVYGMIEDAEAMCLFMRSHVFAVWDFMSLLKSLQRALTCTSHPWVPVRDVNSARLVNEIVLEEETDEIRTGLYISHFELYLEAMDEVGADRIPIDQLLSGVRAGAEIDSVLSGLDVPLETREFVKYTLHAAQLPPHQVASIFLMGREDVIPAMFMNILEHEQHGSGPPRRWRLRAQNLLWKVAKGLERRYSPWEVQVPQDVGDHIFRTYLERHIELDGESHGPMGQRLLMEVCGKDAEKWREATEAALEALKMRRLLWDGVMREIQHMRSRRHDERVRSDEQMGVPPERRAWTWGANPPEANIRAIDSADKASSEG